MIGATGEDYLKVIYKLGLSFELVTPSMVAEQLEVSPAAVTKMIQRLQDKNVLRYSRKKGLVLTAAGEKIALEVLRHHRLIEMFLMEALGYSWDQVHDEAEKLEHVISEEFETRIDDYLGNPTHDPHGAPIPTKDGKIETIVYPSMADMEAGQIGYVRQVNNDNSELLKYVGNMGIYPGVKIELIRKEPFGGLYYVNIDGQEQILGRELLHYIFVSIEEGES